ncbi:hypothetical protein CXF97_22665 [Pseudomonas sp. Choline-02u-1]|nr:hypothetical protein CXF97_22665 [Pseudomonas sp. Choline-02u-1]
MASRRSFRRRAAYRRAIEPSPIGGAGLLAKRDCQPAWMLNVKPSSRAGSLYSCFEYSGFTELSGNAQVRVPSATRRFRPDRT